MTAYEREMTHERERLDAEVSIKDAEIQRLRERVVELESKLAECAATCEFEAKKARLAALEEALRLIRAELPKFEAPIGQEPVQTVALELLSLHAGIRALMGAT